MDDKLQKMGDVWKWFASPMSDGFLYPIPRVAIVLGCILILWIDNRLLERI